MHCILEGNKAKGLTIVSALGILYCIERISKAIHIHEKNAPTVDG